LSKSCQKIKSILVKKMFKVFLILVLWKHVTKGAFHLFFSFKLRCYLNDDKCCTLIKYHFLKISRNNKPLQSSSVTDLFSYTYSFQRK
jgi:hypothetical protein